MKVGLKLFFYDMFDMVERWKFYYDKRPTKLGLSDKIGLSENFWTQALIFVIQPAMTNLNENPANAV